MKTRQIWHCPLEFVFHQCFSRAAMSVMAVLRHLKACLIQMGVRYDRLRNRYPEHACDIEYADTERITSTSCNCRVGLLSIEPSKPKVVWQMCRAYPTLVCKPTFQMRSIVHAPAWPASDLGGHFSAFRRVLCICIVCASHAIAAASPAFTDHCNK
jgi:hypothetical protein